MITKVLNTKVIQVHRDDMLWTVVRSYNNIDGIEPVYTIIQEDAQASPLYVQSNKKAHAVDTFFNGDITSLFD